MMTFFISKKGKNQVYAKNVRRIVDTFKNVQGVVFKVDTPEGKIKEDK